MVPKFVQLLRPFSLLFLLISSAVFAAQRDLAVYDIFFLPGESDVKSYVTWKYEFDKQLTYKDEKLGNTDTTSKRIYDTYYTTSNIIQTYLSIGASAVLEAGIEQDLALSVVRTHNDTEADNGVLADDQESSGLYDPVFFGRYRFLERQWGNAMSDLILKVSPNLIASESDSSTSAPRPGNVTRGGHQIGFFFESGLKREEFSTLLGIGYTYGGSREVTDIGSSTVTTYGTQKFIDLYIKTQYQTSRKRLLTLDLLINSRGSVDYQDGSTATINQEKHTKFEMDVGGKFILFNGDVFFRLVGGMFYINNFHYRKNGTIQSTVRGHQGYNLQGGLEFIF